jgi:hypothetical protein
MGRPWFLCAVSLLAFGCSPALREDDMEVSALADKADGVVRPQGYYINRSAQPGDLFSLNLIDLPDFEREVWTSGCTPNDQPFSNTTETVRCFASFGTVKFTKSSTAHYIRLIGDQGQLADRLAYKVGADGTLQLREDTGDEWSTLTPDVKLGIEFGLYNNRADQVDVSLDQLPASTQAVVQAVMSFDSSPYLSRLTYLDQTFYTLSFQSAKSDQEVGFVYSADGALMLSGAWVEGDSTWVFDVETQDPSSCFP